ncbi:MAG: folate family ECF transporter S component [Eubacteriales bacterium]|nr:folate family ECF transporter S component [Eubacteriales bacterium]
MRTEYRTGYTNGAEVFARLKDVRVLAGTGMLSAIAIVLGFFKVPLTQLIELRFATLPVAVAGYLFGPVCAGLVGLVADVGGYLVHPTGPFFPGFTVTSIISGIIFGCMLYNKKPTVQRIFAAQIIYTLICGILLNSLWLSILYGRGFLVVLGTRLVKELVMIPVNTAMLSALMEPVQHVSAPEHM